MANPKQPNPDPPADELAVDWTTEPTPAYVTGAHITHSPREFSLLFDEGAGFPGRNAPPGNPRRPLSRIVASLRIPPDTYFQILCALASSWNRFALQFMDPKLPRPRFRLVDSGTVQLEGADDVPPRTAH